MHFILFYFLETGFYYLVLTDLEIFYEHQVGLKFTKLSMPLPASLVLGLKAFTMPAWQLLLLLS